MFRVIIVFILTLSYLNWGKYIAHIINRQENKYSFSLVINDKMLIKTGKCDLIFKFTLWINNSLIDSKLELILRHDHNISISKKKKEEEKLHCLCALLFGMFSLSICILKFKCLDCIDWTSFYKRIFICCIERYKNTVTKTNEPFHRKQNHGLGE